MSPRTGLRTGPRAAPTPPRITPAALDQLAARVTTTGPRRTLIVEAPFTATQLGAVPHCEPGDVAEAVRRARAAQPAWAARPVEERARVALRYHDRVLNRQDEVLDLIQLESGKARRDAFEEVLDTALVARYYAHTAPRHLRPRRRQGALPLLTSVTEHHHPKGVIGVIAPWNYPLTLGISDAIPALLAGNGVVVKPDEQTPYAALWAAQLLEQAGLPPGLVQVVTGPGAELGPALIGAGDYLMFTGSTAVGRQVASRAGEGLVDASMELGGKNALLVRADADLHRAVPGTIAAAFSNAGQLCISIERAYVHTAVWDAFVPRLVEATKRLHLGTGLDYTAEVGSLVSARQLQAVTRHVADAVAKGATVLAGGRARPDIGPYCYEPTLLTDARADMTLFADETFGPVVALTRVHSDEEAVERANDSRYGLNASIWTRDVRRGRALATRLQAGTVNVNEGYAAGWGSVDAPMGGFKDSGLGRRHGATGITKYTEAQTVAVQRGLPLHVPPYLSAASYAGLMSAGLRVLRHIPGVR